MVVSTAALFAPWAEGNEGGQIFFFEENSLLSGFIH